MFVSYSKNMIPNCCWIKKVKNSLSIGVLYKARSYALEIVILFLVFMWDFVNTVKIMSTLYWVKLLISCSTSKKHNNKHAWILYGNPIRTFIPIDTMEKLSYDKKIFIDLKMLKNAQGCILQSDPVQAKQPLKWPNLGKCDITLCLPYCFMSLSAFK